MLASNAGAIQFYEQAGFKVMEHLPGHYKRLGREDGVRLERELRGGRSSEDVVMN